MPRPNPGPPAAGTTIHAIGDTHAGPTGIAAWRLDAIVRDAHRPHMPIPDAVVQLGDCTNDTPGPDTPHFTAFLARFRAPAYAVMGNHDVYAQTPQQWATSMGYASPSYVIDLPGVQVIAWATSDAWANYDTVSTDRLAWLDAQLSATTKPVILACHIPPFGTVRSGGGNDETTTASPFFLRTAAKPSNSDGVLDVLAAHDNVKAWLCGHTHSRLEVPGLVTAVEYAGRRIAVINASSPGYTTGASPTAMGNRVATAYVTLLEDRIEVRYRDHGAGQWATPHCKQVFTVDGLG